MTTPMTLKTVPRNTNRAKAILAAATNCRAYSLSNGFSGTETTADWIAKQLHDPQCPGKLVDQGAGSFCVRVHSNLWFEFNAVGV